MRISDWSSDVCSSDLPGGEVGVEVVAREREPVFHVGFPAAGLPPTQGYSRAVGKRSDTVNRFGATVDLQKSKSSSRDRKSVVYGKSVSVRVDLGGRRIIKKNHDQQLSNYYKSK